MSGLSALVLQRPIRHRISVALRDEFEATILTRQECFEFLGRTSVGRIGVNIDALPVILPVHFALHDDSVLVRTMSGTKLDAATIGAVVAFQSDAWDPSDGTWWSVLFQGMASEVTKDARSAAVSIRSWGNVDGVRHLVRIDTTNASGRRFRIAGEGPQVEFPDPPPL